MTRIKTPIIPQEQTFAKVYAPHELHLEAICVFSAIGFFLDQDTYWRDEVVLRPASNHLLDDQGFLVDSQPWFEWHHSPKDVSFDQCLDDFTHLFETIISEQTQHKKVILPLSGGIDSRSQAAALDYLDAEVLSYSYAFENGYPETLIAKEIAKSCNFEYKDYTITQGYLWKHLDALVKLNKCYSDFSAPRQMAIHDELSKLDGQVFSLGHWGDVLFDSMDLPQLSDLEEIDVIEHKLLKKGGLKFATDLWNAWGLTGNFEEYFRSRISGLLQTIQINDTNAKLRAFKSLYWAPRWTAINLSVFSSVKPITLPYFDDRMCQFICTVPEAFLKNRQLQIAYIKKRTPALANITWQEHRPFNLSNFHLNKAPYNLPYRVVHKIKRSFNAAMGNPYVQRNWELQFLGSANQAQLKDHLFNARFEQWIPKSLITHYYDAFTRQDSLTNAHAINMLLVFAKFNQLNASTFRQAQDKLSSL